MIRAEYVREFIGEGQLFFYYNGMLLQHIPDGGTVNSNKDISLDSYVFPLPDSERAAGRSKRNMVLLKRHEYEKDNIYDRSFLGGYRNDQL